MYSNACATRIGYSDFERQLGDINHLSSFEKEQLWKRLIQRGKNKLQRSKVSTMFIVHV